MSFADGKNNQEALTSEPTASVAPGSGPLVGFTVVDASDQTVVEILTDGGALVLDDPDNGSYGIRADVETDAEIGSVRLELTGAKDVDKTENLAPYSLYGDSDGNLNGQALPTGQYTLKTTAYAEPRLEGAVLGTLEVSFTVTETSAEEEAQNSPATGAPTIGGDAYVGETLTADTSGVEDADGLGNAVFEYQWLAENTEVAGATSSTYTPVDADVGKTIKVRVTFTDEREQPRIADQHGDGPRRPGCGRNGTPRSHLVGNSDGGPDRRELRIPELLESTGGVARPGHLRSGRRYLHRWQHPDGGGLLYGFWRGPGATGRLHP